MAINAGDVVFTFLGDTQNLDQAFNRVASEAGAKLKPAQTEVGKLGDTLEKTGEQAEVSGAQIGSAASTASKEYKEVARQTVAVARATAQLEVEQSALEAAISAASDAGDDNAAAMQNVADQTARADAAATNLAGAEKKLELAMNDARKATGRVIVDNKQAKDSLDLMAGSFGIVLPRELKKYIAGLEGIAPALSAAFKVGVVLAFVDVLLNAGEEMSNFISKTFIFTQAMEDEYKAQVKLNESMLAHKATLQGLKDEFRLVGLQGAARLRVEVELLNESLQKSEIELAQNEIALANYGKTASTTQGILLGLAATGIPLIADVSGAVLDKLNAATVAQTNLTKARIAELQAFIKEVEQRIANNHKAGNVAQLQEDITLANALIEAWRTYHESKAALALSERRVEIAFNREHYSALIAAEQAYQEQIFQIKHQALLDQIAELERNPAVNKEQIIALNAQVEELEAQHQAKLNDIVAAGINALNRLQKSKLTGELVTVNTETLDALPAHIEVIGGKIINTSEQITTAVTRNAMEIEQAYQRLGIDGFQNLQERMSEAVKGYRQLIAAGAERIDIIAAEIVMLQLQIRASAAAGEATGQYRKDLAALVAEYRKLIGAQDESGNAMERLNKKMKKQQGELKGWASQADMAIGAFSDAFGSAFKSWILGLDSFGHALRVALAEELAVIAGKAAAWAAYWAAWGVIDLFWAPERAAGDFAAAAQFAAIAITYGAAAKLIAPKDKGEGGLAGTPIETAGSKEGESAERTAVTEQNSFSFASGAIVTRPTRAIIGDARKAGSGSNMEGVFPLDDPNAMSMLREAMGMDSGGGTQIHVHVKGMISTDNLRQTVRRISRDVDSGKLRLKSSETGRVVRKG